MVIKNLYIWENDVGLEKKLKKILYLKNKNLIVLF